MADKATTNANMYLTVDTDANLIPINIKSAFLPVPTSTTIGAVKAGTNITIASDGTISATGGAGGSTIIQVDGTTVNPVNNAINFVDSTAQINRVLVSNPNTNQVAFNIDANTNLIAASLAASNVSGTGSVTFDYPDSGSTQYTLFMPSNIGAVNQVLAINSVVDTLVNLAWVNQSGGGGVSSVALSAPSPLTVSGSPITSSGTLTLAWGTGQIPVANLGSGTPSTTTFLRGDGTWAVPPSGGGSSLTASVRWTTANATSKNAFTSPGVVNSDGLTFTLTASSGSGSITGVTITLNGVALTNTYSSTGSFPTYSIVVPAADLTGNAAETASVVTVGLTGTFSGGNFNISANNLSNVQPVPFTTVLSASYSQTSVPFYQTTGTVNYSYTNSSDILSFGGTLNFGGGFIQNATSPSGTFSNPQTLLNGFSYGGSATGNGKNGAGQGTVNFSGSVPGPTVYIPAFYAETATSTPPTFTSASLQTSGDAQGSTITYPVAGASTNYIWIATQRPLANIFFVTPFGNTPLVPDVMAPDQTIGVQTFRVYGVTNLSTINPVVLQVN